MTRTEAGGAIGLVDLTQAEKAEIKEIRIIRPQPLPSDIAARIRKAPEEEPSADSTAIN